MAFYGDSGEPQWPYSYDPNSYPTQSPLIPYPYPYPYTNLTQNPPNHCTSYYLDYQPPISQTSYYYIPSSSSSSPCSASAPHDDVFEEFDPDPYSGGYDIVQTYGEPLPPSGQTCYPRSAPDPEGMSYGSGAEGGGKGGNGNHGSGLDLCGGFFGYWPCWEKHKKKGGNNNGLGQEKGNSSSNGGDEDSLWNDYCALAADYIFGSPFEYGDFSYANYHQEY